MSSREAFYIHAFVALMCLSIGMSESYPWLAWARALVPIAPFLVFGGIAIPFVILWLAVQERRRPIRVAAAFVLSAVAERRLVLCHPAVVHVTCVEKSSASRPAWPACLQSSRLAATFSLMRLIMMGTGPFAAPTFRSLYESPHEMAALVTAPARSHRGQKVPPPSELREIAARHNTPILDPEDANAAAEQARLAALGADLLVVCDYGQILAPQNARRRPLRRRQPARFALAEVSRGGPNPMGHLPRRDGDGRDGDPHDAATRRRAVCGPASRRHPPGRNGGRVGAAVGRRRGGIDPPRGR